jgi:hypothetical protein
VLRHAVVLLSFVLLPLEALAQEDNEFARRTSTDFVTTPPPKEMEPGSIFAAAGKFTGLVQLDNILTTGPNYYPFSNLFAESVLNGFVSITKWFTINGLLRLEQVYDEPDASGLFSDQALYIQRLFGVINLTPVYLYGGKIHPRFGMAWYATPGLYGSDFAEDYEIEEKLGFGARLDLRTLGRHRITVEAYQADTSFLTANMVPGPGPGDPRSTRQAKGSLAQGGISNTGTFESFAVAISSRRHLLEGITTDFGWAKQKASPLDVKDQYSWAAGVTWQFDITKDVSLQPLAEFVSITGQNGQDRNADYLTLAANLRVGDNWAFAVHTTQRNVRDYGANNFYTDWLAGLAAAYDIGSVFKDRLPWLNGISLVTGYRHDRKIGVDRDTIGFQVRYERNL